MKNNRWKKLMVAIRDTSPESRALLRKAVALADRFGASLEVLHVSAVNDEVFTIPTHLRGPNSLEEIRKAQQHWLQKMVKPLQTSSRRITCVSVLDYPIFDGIVRQVIKRKPDLLIANSPHHSRAARLFLANSDWELIRNCPCPLWLAKSTRLKPSLSVLASVDPFHSHAKSVDLDSAILDAAGQVVGTGAGRLSVVHAYTVPPNLTSGVGEVAVLVPATPAESRRHKTRVRDMVKRTTKRYAIAARNLLIVEGEPATCISQQAKKSKADVLVMGAVSRLGLKRIFIGHTAERVLDDVQCDILVIKPASFKSSVTRQTATAR
ncbi:MAG: universal stress protein [Steroidobacteraceae bacterium]